MINWVLEKAAKYALGGKLISAVAWTHDVLEGHRSEILLALAGIIHLLKAGGVLDAQLAATAETALLGAVAPALQAKFKRAAEMADRVVPAPKP